METKKYILTDEKKEHQGRTLYRIKAIREFWNIKKGDIGGWLESENNLSHEGDAWVGENASVYGNARVGDNAKVSDDAWVYGNAEVGGTVRVSDDAWVYGNAHIYGDADICGDAEICDDADCLVFKNWWYSRRHFTWTRSNNKWKVGCFYGTGDELVQKAYADSKKSGREYERIVKYVESILADEND